jgi:hypothetical protein
VIGALDAGSARVGVKFAMRLLRGTTLVLAACMALAGPVAAETSDAAYCARLSELALRYTGKVGLEGEIKPMPATVVAMEACKQGNYATGIPVLEQTLRDNRITLPTR